jgi:hypothetical protein
VRAVSAVWMVPGSFAALRMTAKTDNGGVDVGVDVKEQGADGVAWMRCLSTVWLKPQPTMAAISSDRKR